MHLSDDCIFVCILSMVYNNIPEFCFSLVVLIVHGYNASATDRDNFLQNSIGNIYVGQLFVVCLPNHIPHNNKQYFQTIFLCLSQQIFVFLFWKDSQLFLFIF